ncbi:MAG: hypothetical protein AAF843_10360 [Bacteroidota bacterium]
MKTVLIIFGSLFPLYIQGQNNNIYLSLGPSLGRSFSTIAGTQVDNSLDPSRNSRAYVEDRNDLCLGLDVKVEWKYVFVKSGYQLTQRGGEVVGSRFIEEDKIHLKLHAIPLFLGVQPFTWDKMKVVNVNAFGGIVYQWDRGSTDAGLWNGPRNFPILSLAYGAAVELKVGPYLRLNFQYQKIRDITDYYTVDIDGHGKYEAHTKGQMVMGGLLFTLNP